MRVPALLLLVVSAAPVLLSDTPSAQRRAVPREAGVPFTVGETLTYDVTWSSYLVAGTAVTTVRDKMPSQGSTAYAIVAEGKPLPLLARLYTLFYRMESVLDAATLLPQRVSLYSEEGNRRRTGITRFDRGARRAVFEVQGPTQGAATATSQFQVPAEALDGLSAVYSLRARPLKAGHRLTLAVADDGSMYDVRISIGEAERISVPFGSVDAWKLAMVIVDAHGQPAATDAAVWISTDARRLPVRLQAGLPVGEFVLLLRDAR